VGVCVLLGREVSATDCLLVQRSPTECGVSVCDLETSNREAAQARFGLLRHWKEEKERKFCDKVVQLDSKILPRPRSRTGGRRSATEMEQWRYFVKQQQKCFDD
jgi:hypothetical protein